VRPRVGVCRFVGWIEAVGRLKRKDRTRIVKNAFEVSSFLRRGREKEIEIEERDSYGAREHWKGRTLRTHRDGILGKT